MDQKELITALTAMDLHELRQNTGEQFEAVVKCAQKEMLSRLLSSFFGLPVKAEGKSPDKNAKQISASYGGIRSNQTLYCVDHEGGMDVAMIWPWNDSSFLTLKIFWKQSKKTGLVEKKQSSYFQTLLKKLVSGESD